MKSKTLKEFPMRLERFLISAAVVAMLSTTVPARVYISIAESSTILPYATMVAEALWNNPNFKMPVVKSGG